MNTSQIGVFIALSEYLNFSKTAESLYVSQSYVSKQISKLEEEWQVQLFHRDHHRVILTPAGEYMRNFFVRYQQELVTALKSARSLSSAAEQRLRIGVFSHLDFRQGPEIIRALRAEAPVQRSPWTMPRRRR